MALQPFAYQSGMCLYEDDGTPGTVATMLCEAGELVHQGLKELADRSGPVHWAGADVPGVSDDGAGNSGTGISFEVGSRWLYGTRLFVCVDNSANAAVWKELYEVSTDTTPQLGGSLDVNGQSIVSVSNGDIPITPDGSGKVILDGLNWPVADGAAGCLLGTTGGGQLAWYADGLGLENVSEDATPQLGGNLDVNGQSIVSVSNGDIPITPDGSGKVILDGLNWPVEDGGACCLLGTTGGGQLCWYAQGGVGIECVEEDTAPVLGGDLDGTTYCVHFQDAAGCSCMNINACRVCAKSCSSYQCCRGWTRLSGCGLAGCAIDCKNGSTIRMWASNDPRSGGAGNIDYFGVCQVTAAGGCCACGAGGIYAHFGLGGLSAYGCWGACDTVAGRIDLLNGAGLDMSNVGHGSKLDQVGSCLSLYRCDGLACFAYTPNKLEVLTDGGDHSFCITTCGQFDVGLECGNMSLCTAQGNIGIHAAQGNLTLQALKIFLTACGVCIDADPGAAGQLWVCTSDHVLRVSCSGNM